MLIVEVPLYFIIKSHFGISDSYRLSNKGKYIVEHLLDLFSSLLDILRM